VEQKIECQHTQPTVKSDLFDLILIYLKKSFPATPGGGYLPSDDPPALALAIGEGGVPPSGYAALGGDEEPLAGATVTASIQGPGVLGDDELSGVTDANGQVTLNSGINKFGAYNITVKRVVGADGTEYEFDQDSILSLTYEVGPVCELTPTPSP
jgi:hypothetical protein